MLSRAPRRALRRRTIRPVIVAALAGLAFSAAAAPAAHAAVVTRISQPFSQLQVNPCNGEFVQLDGTFDLLFRVTQSASGGEQIGSQVRFTLTGIGAFGNLYSSNTVIPATAHFGFAVGAAGPFVNQETSETELIAKGAAPNFLSRFVIHETFMPDGSVTADVLHSDNVCRG